MVCSGEPKVEVEGEKKDYDDFACEKCGKKDHPEWILLCDSCDQGWHASCLRPSLMLVPVGDWHCPPCQHVSNLWFVPESLLNCEQNENFTAILKQLLLLFEAQSDHIKYVNAVLEN